MGGVASMFGGVDHPDGYMEDIVDASGHHTKKTVHKGDGWESVSIESDGPMDIADIGGIIGQMIQAQQMQQMRGLQQLNGNSPFGQMRQVPLPMMLQHLFDEEDEFEEDHRAVIDELENSRRRPDEPVFGGNQGGPIHFTPEIVHDDHALVPKDDPIAHLKFKAEPTTKHPHIHNDLESHSSFYMFSTMVLIAAVGFLFWQYFLKEASTDTKSSNEPVREIRLSNFTKEK
jgi:hypothetical protein